MLFNNFYKNFQTPFRMMRTIALRPFRLLQSRFSNFFNAVSVGKISRSFQKLVSNFFKDLKLKPTKRSDYIDVGSVFVAKILVIVMFALIIGIIALFVVVLWPWFAHNILTARFYQSQKEIPQYSGKVAIYYDKSFHNKMFEGRLDHGDYTGQGKIFYENGAVKYKGNFSKGKYQGEGITYSKSGQEVYNGNFRSGQYNGQGTLHIDKNDVYKGAFSNNTENGQGSFYKGNTRVFQGNMKDGKKSGSGTSYYDDGNTQYVGDFSNDVFEGNGKMYYDKSNVLKYNGAFSNGEYSGKGIQYDQKGNLLYTGDFVNGLYDGNGKLILQENQSWYEGAFTQGKKNGSGKLYKNNQLYYDGSFAGDMMSGQGKLTDVVSGFEYDGSFANNDIDYGSLFAQQPSKIYTMFPTGMTQDTSKPDASYYYNTTYGALLKISYGTGQVPATLTNAYTLPVNSPIQKINSMDDLKLENYKAGDTSESTPDATVCGYLSVSSVPMKVYRLLFSKYMLVYYADKSTGDVKLIEYDPVSSAQPASTTTSQSQNSTTAAFQSLGLNQSDFSSLGY